MSDLRAPFPWFGGKRKAAEMVWERLGDVANYVEPFFGSGAMLLGRPEGHHWPRTETVNDYDGHLANFWRALQADPDGVAHYADWPVSELDSHARGGWLFYRPDAREWVERLRSDPDYYDVKSAGWWVWFVCGWIAGLPSVNESQLKRIPGGAVKRQLPHLGTAGMGIHRTGAVSRKLPHLGDAGKGIHRTGAVNRQLPHLGNAGMGIHRVGKGSRGEHLREYFGGLAARLERVRVCCGDWARVTGRSVTTTQGLTGVFLDPPYSHAVRDGGLYSEESGSVAEDVRAWAIANGDNPLFRIVLCGYENEHGDAMPDSWTVVEWKAPKGYASQRTNGVNDNRKLERIWFSPHCLRPEAEPALETNGVLF